MIELLRALLGTHYMKVSAVLPGCLSYDLIPCYPVKYLSALGLFGLNNNPKSDYLR